MKRFCYQGGDNPRSQYPRRHRRKPVLIFVTALSFFIGTLPIKSFAIGDAAVVAQLVKNLAELQKQYNKMAEQYDVLKNQYQAVESLKQDAEGHYGFGNLLNSVSDLKDREWSPGSWQDALKGLAGNNPSRYQELVKEYQSAHPTLSENTIEESESASNAKAYESEAKSNLAAGVNATYAFNNVQTQLQNIHTLSMQIESTKNTKAALDLNARLLAEIAYLQVQALKMQTLLNEQAAARGANDLAGESTAAEFDKLPTN